MRCCWRNIFDVPMSDRLATRTLPHNLEAERSILGAILLHNEVWPQVASVLAADEMFRDAHRRIFSVMEQLSEDRVAIDLVTVKDVLSRRGELDECGGPAYIASLVDGVPR